MPVGEIVVHIRPELKKVLSNREGPSYDRIQVINYFKCLHKPKIFAHFDQDCQKSMDYMAEILGDNFDTLSNNGKLNEINQKIKEI